MCVFANSVSLREHFLIQEFSPPCRPRFPNRFLNYYDSRGASSYSYRAEYFMYACLCSFLMTLEGQLSRLVMNVRVLAQVEINDVLILVGDVLEALRFVHLDFREDRVLLLLVGHLHLLDLLLLGHAHLGALGSVLSMAAAWRRTCRDLRLAEGTARRSQRGATRNLWRHVAEGRDISGPQARRRAHETFLVDAKRRPPLDLDTTASRLSRVLVIVRAAVIRDG